MDPLARVLDTSPVADLAAHLEAGGGRGIATALDGGPDAALAVVEAAGLRGRGGAGFPTAAKWRSVLEYATGDPAPTVVVNAAEGEPGSFKDRAILRANPYRVLEGALIAASVIGADEVVVATKASFTTEVSRLRQAIDEIVDAGWLEGVSIDVVEGPAEYLFGEETALLEVVEGRMPFPRIAPPWRRGVDDPGVAVPLPDDDDAAGISPPTLVNNVETMAHAAMILAEGPAWFREHGTEESPGTIVCTVSGDVDSAGVVEVPMGTTLGEVVIQVGGDRAAEAIAVLPGVSAPIVPFDLFDTPLTYEAMADAGSALGTGGFIVLGPDTDPVAVAEGVSRFLAVESCGQCSPCKEDGLAIADALGRLRAGRTSGDELQTVGARLATVDTGARCYLATQQREVVSSLVGLFPTEVAVADPSRPARPRYLVAELADLVEGSEGPEAVLDDAQATKQPDWSQDATWSGKVPVERFDQHASSGG
ncbi:MAG: SLBB domain-containing protein [Acidimicrobiales bacterium]|nr:SLBB domain-containing protein [Acidimicrobiales bacterium]